jgi:hypothetical protein
MKVVSKREYEAEKLRMIEQLKERTCVKDIFNDVWFFNSNGVREPVHMLVNFACLGAVEPIVASRYADCIKEAADIAKNFKYNGYIVKDIIEGYSIPIREDEEQ